MSYPLYMFFVAMASGVPVAISKMISEKKAKGDIEGIFVILKEATILMMFLGIGTTLALFIFAKPIINSEELINVITKFSKIRKNQPAFQLGNYKELSVTNETFAFERKFNDEKIIVAVNISSEEKEIVLKNLQKEDFGKNCKNLLTEETFVLEEKIKVPKNWLFVGKVK